VLWLGKLISKKKFLSIVESGFGFCSVVFGWDMHDKTYFRELGISNAANGYRDLLAKVDLQSFRRIPWEDGGGAEKGVPFFLISFHDPETKEPIPPCPRGLLSRTVGQLEQKGWGAMAGG
jgi:glutamine synthetase